MQTSKIAQTVTDLVKRRAELTAEIAHLDSEISAIREAVIRPATSAPKFPTPGTYAVKPTKADPRHTRGKVKQIVRAFAGAGNEFLRYKDLSPIIGSNHTTYVRRGVLVSAGPGRYALSPTTKAAYGLV